MLASRLALLSEQRAGVLARVSLARWKSVVTLLLVFWLANSLAQMFWLLLAPSPAFAQSSLFSQRESLNRALVDTPQAVLDSVDIEALKKLTLFGLAGEIESQAPIPEATSTIEQDAVDTGLKLALAGVINSSSPIDSRAIIADGSRQKLYAPGDALPAGQAVRLLKVLVDRVILDNNGRYESLWLYLDEDIPVAPARRTSTPVREQSAKGSVARSIPAAASLRGKVLSDVIKFSLARKGGDVIGYKIRAGRDAALFRQLGLEDNDIVTSVNGLSLGSTAQAMEIHKTLRGANSAVLEILRNNQSTQVPVSVE